MGIKKIPRREVRTRCISHYKKAFGRIPTEYFKLSHEQLQCHFRFSYRLHILRLKFWHELYKSRLLNRSMRKGQIYKTICHRSYFNRDILENPAKLAWLLKYPTDVLRAVENYPVTEMRDLLDVVFPGINPGKAWVPRDEKHLVACIEQFYEAWALHVSNGNNTTYYLLLTTLTFKPSDVII